MMAILYLLDPLVLGFFVSVRSSFLIRGETGGRWIVRGPAVCLAPSPVEMAGDPAPGSFPCSGLRLL